MPPSRSVLALPVCLWLTSAASAAPLPDTFRDPDRLPDGAVARLGLRPPRHDGAVDNLALSGDGKLLASSGKDRFVRVWDTATGRQRLMFPWPDRDAEVRRLAFSPDAKVLALGRPDQRIDLVAVSSGKALRSLAVPGLGQHRPLFDFSPDGKGLVTAGGRTVRLWDVETGRETTSFEVETKSHLLDLMVTPDGKRMAAATGDERVRLLDFPAGKELQSAAGPRECRGAGPWPCRGTASSSRQSARRTFASGTSTRGRSRPSADRLG